MGSIEKPTLIERFVELIPLPYAWAALVWTIILGPLGGVFSASLDTGQVVYHFIPAVVYNSISLTITLFYLFYIPRYLRLRILRAEKQIVPIMPGGEEEYHAAFRRFSSATGIILVTIPFLIPVLGVVPLRLSIYSGYSLIQYFIIVLGLGNFVWDYAVSNWGLHRLGRSKLKLRSFLEDRMMGAKPLGNTALSTTVTYLGGLLFFTLLGTSVPNLNNPALYAVVVLLLALGIVMFFLPLNSIHRKMEMEKTRFQKDLNLNLQAMIRPSQIESSNGPVSSVNSDAISQLLRLKELEITERKLANTPTWPFDVQVIARLITIIVSVTAVLLSRFITDYLIRI